MNLRLVMLLSMVGIVGLGASRIQEPRPLSRDLSDGVEVTSDLVYATYGSRELRLDLYRPAERDDEPLPVVVVVRGGGWRVGDKNGFRLMAGALAVRGLAAVCIEYRASGEAKYPAAVHDVKAAIRWTRAHAREHGLDPDAIGVIGGSAGAHLAVLAALTTGDPQLEGDGGNPDTSSAVYAVVGLGTPTDVGEFGKLRSSGPHVEFIGVPFEEDEALWRSASPVSRVDGMAPPTLLMHSPADDTVPYNQAVRLAEQYRKAGATVELVPMPDAPHSFWSFEEWFDETVDRAAPFLKKHLCRDESAP